MNFKLRASARRRKNHKKSLRERVRQRSVHQTRSSSAPGSSGSVSGRSRGGFWTIPGPSWTARGAPRSVPGRLLGVPGPSRARPGASPKRPWAPKPARDRFLLDFWSLGERFSSILDRFFVDFGLAQATFSVDFGVLWLASRASLGSTMARIRRHKIRPSDRQRASWHMRCLFASCCACGFRRLFVRPHLVANIQVHLV